MEPVKVTFLCLLYQAFWSRQNLRVECLHLEDFFCSDIPPLNDPNISSRHPMSPKSQIQNVVIFDFVTEIWMVIFTDRLYGFSVFSLFLIHLGRFLGYR